MNTDWVEIIEPKSKERIYANLETGVCAKFPPPGATVSRAEDYSDHWWELYDTKNGKYYYYNVDRQETVWRRPQGNPSSGGKQILIIPVTKLQTYRRVVSGDKDIEKKDASTQTASQSTSTTGTQTRSILRTSSSAAAFDGSNLRSSDIPMIHKNQSNCPSVSAQQQFRNSHQQPMTNSFNHLRGGLNSSVQHKKTRPYKHVKKGFLSNVPASIGDHDNSLSNPSSLSSSLERAEGSLQSSHIDGKINHQCNSKPASIYRKNISSTSRVDPDCSQNQARPFEEQQRLHSSYQNRLPASNLSHYLAREARSMGIALISDDEEADDEDVESDEDYPVDEDEEEESGSFRNHNDDHRSADLDNSSEGWKSLSSDQDEDHDCQVYKKSGKKKNQINKGQIIRLNPTSAARVSPENIYDDVYEQRDLQGRVISQETPPSTSQVVNSDDAQGLAKYESKLISSSTTAPDSRSNQFIHGTIECKEQKDELNDEDRSPTELLSQELNHYKLVNNFKKRGTSASQQFNDVVTKLNNLSTGTHNNDRSSIKKFSLHSQPSDNHLREVSTLSTLPRPHKFAKDKPALSKQAQISVSHTDDTYDKVHDGCGYHSDSEPTVAQQQSTGFHANSVGSGSKLPTTTNDGPNSLDSASLNYNKGSRGSTFSVESFAKENLTRYPKKGSLNAMLFNRKVKWSRMITWTRSTIKQSMITSLGSNLNNDAISCFKLIQQFMGDRKVALTKKLRAAIAEAEASKDAGAKNQSNSSSIGKSWSKSPAKSSTSSLRRSLSDAGGNMPDNVRDELAYELISIGCSKSPLRDEIYVQIARQVTQNPSQQSIEWGLILMAIALSYFSPSIKFSPFLFSFLENHDHPMARDVCQPRLEKRIQNSWTTYCRKPASGNEITIVRLSITKWPQYCSVFGESLDRLMKLQSCSPYLRTLQLPWILTVLGEKLLETGGARTEGIFRCAADCDMIAQLKLEIDCLDFRRITDAEQVKSLFANVVDPHVIAGLLKLFFRELPNSVFPCQLYDVCLHAATDLQATSQVVMEQVPDINKYVIGYLISLLQVLAKEENVITTKMDTSNLSMVWAPNLLRSTASSTSTMSNMGIDISGSVAACGSTLERRPKDQAQQMMTQPQSLIFEKARQEMQFIRHLITNLDTDYVVDVV